MSEGERFIVFQWHDEPPHYGICDTETGDEYNRGSYDQCSFDEQKRIARYLNENVQSSGDDAFYFTEVHFCLANFVTYAVCTELELSVRDAITLRNRVCPKTTIYYYPSERANHGVEIPPQWDAGYAESMVSALSGSDD